MLNGKNIFYNLKGCRCIFFFLSGNISQLAILCLILIFSLNREAAEQKLEKKKEKDEKEEKKRLEAEKKEQKEREKKEQDARKKFKVSETEWEYWEMGNFAHLFTFL